MTDTLRKIDAELAVVVQCKGGYFRRISVRKVFSESVRNYVFLYRQL